MRGFVRLASVATDDVEVVSRLIGIGGDGVEAVSRLGGCGEVMGSTLDQEVCTTLQFRRWEMFGVILAQGDCRLWGFRWSFRA